MGIPTAILSVYLAHDLRHFEDIDFDYGIPRDRLPFIVRFAPLDP
jgi:hypothetical protein